MKGRYKETWRVRSVEREKEIQRDMESETEIQRDMESESCLGRKGDKKRHRE